MASKLIFDSLSPASVTFCVNGARENAGQVREEISSEQWQRLNRLFHPDARAARADPGPHSINDLLASVVDGIHLFKGVSDTTMIHGQGWQFIRLGRYLERPTPPPRCSRSTSRICFRCMSARTPATSTLNWWGCCAVVPPSRRTARSTPPISRPAILEFLLLNRDFPHTIRYTVDGIRHAVESIQRTGGAVLRTS